MVAIIPPTTLWWGNRATTLRVNFVAFDLHPFNAAGKIEKTWHLEDYGGLYCRPTHVGPTPPVP